MVDKNLVAEFKKDQQERHLANGGQQGKAEGFLLGQSSGGANENLSLSNRKEDKSFSLPDGSAEMDLKEPINSIERLLAEIDKRCVELFNYNRASILALTDTRLKILVNRLEELGVERLGIARESLELKFFQTNNGLALRGYIKLDGGLKLPVEVGRDGSFRFSRPFVLTEQGLVPQSLTNVKFKDDSVLARLDDFVGLRNAFAAVKYVTEQTKGREVALAVKEEKSAVYALAKDQVSRSFYLYKFETVQKDGKSEVVVLKEKAKVEALKEVEGASVKVKSKSSEIVFRLGVSDVVFITRTSERSELLFADER